MKTKSLMEDKRCRGSGPQKAHPTGEFIVVAYNGGCAPFRLDSRLPIVVSEAVRRHFNCDFFKILYQATSKLFRVFKDTFHVRWINIIP